MDDKNCSVSDTLCGGSSCNLATGTCMCHDTSLQWLANHEGCINCACPTHPVGACPPCVDDTVPGRRLLTQLPVICQPGYFLQSYECSTTVNCICNPEPAECVPCAVMPPPCTDEFKDDDKIDLDFDTRCQ
jgi:hypothetical protein